MRRASFALACGTALLAALLGFLLRPSGADAGLAASPTPLAPSEPLPTPAAQAPSQSLAPAADAAAHCAPLRDIPTATPPPPEPDGLEDGGLAPHPEGDFGWKYARASADELRHARRKLVQDYERELARCVERRTRTGSFEEASCEGLDIESLLAELSASGVPHALVTVPLQRPIRCADDAQGASAVRWMRLERCDENALYALADELEWLARAAP
ncbi:MAG: hypothetical protein FJ298_00620 [Planctomycetes bacterium]|nr:hypothetical protein [Planctomycetota bacterium]